MGEEQRWLMVSEHRNSVYLGTKRVNGLLNLKVQLKSHATDGLYNEMEWTR